MGFLEFVVVSVPFILAFAMLASPIKEDIQ